MHKYTDTQTHKYTNTICQHTNTKDKRGQNSTHTHNFNLIGDNPSGDDDGVDHIVVLMVLTMVIVMMMMMSKI